ncbi:heme peroxidase [Zopfochytrium polystomum]|nr:heme peroxidase [Zopfochytrium polystomum]
MPTPTTRPPPPTTAQTPLLADPAPLATAVAVALSAAGPPPPKPGLSALADPEATTGFTQPHRPRRWSISAFFAHLLWALFRRISPWTWLKCPFPIAVLYLAVRNLVALDWNVKDAELVSNPSSLDAVVVAAVPEITDRSARPGGGRRTAHSDPSIRTDTGVGNNRRRCPMGGIGQPFGRNTIVNLQVNLGTPDPSNAARVLLTRDRFKPADSVNLFVAAWIQFLIHDLFDHRLLYRHKITVGELTVHPTEAVPGRNDLFPNACDHFLDASPLYGDTTEAVDLIRQPDGTFLLVNNYLPVDAHSWEEILGHPKNIWFGLGMMTYILALEHNAVVEHFRTLHPDWTGEQLFSKARLVISALVAKIQGIEWTPAIFQHKAAQFGQYHMLYGFLGQRSRKIIGNQRWMGNYFAGILGGHLAYRKVNYATTEEFASVYRMHSLLPDAFTVSSATTGRQRASYAFEDTLFARSHHVNTSHPREDIVYSMGTSPPGTLVLNNYPTALRSVPDVLEPSVRFDLAAVDILRDRERRVPRYNEFRRQFLLNPIRRWSDLTNDPAEQRALAGVYGPEGIEDLDLLVGTLAEKKLPGCVFGETVYSVFLAQTQRRIECDRFLTEDYNAKIYTKEGIEWVENTSFARILRRHFPAIRPFVADDANAFLRWTPRQSA